MSDFIDYNDVSSQSTGKFNLAKKDFELFKEQQSGACFRVKRKVNRIDVMRDKKILHQIDLDDQQQEIINFLISFEGFQFMILCAKRNLNPLENLGSTIVGEAKSMRLH